MLIKWVWNNFLSLLISLINAILVAVVLRKLDQIKGILFIERFLNVAVPIGIAIITFFAIFIIRKYLYDDIADFLSEHSNLMPRFKIGSFILIAFNFLLAIFGTFFLLQFFSAYSFNRPLRLAESVVGKLNDEFVQVDSNAREKLISTVATINNSAHVRKQTIDECHRIDTLKVDVFWYDDNSVIEYTYIGESQNDPGVKCQDTIRTLHWADVPIGEMRKHVTAWNVKLDQQCDISFNPYGSYGIGLPVSMYYICSIPIIESDFEIIERIDCAGALWDSPDAVILDLARFRKGVRLLILRILTDNGTVAITTYNFFVDENYYIIDGLRMKRYNESHEVRVDPQKEEKWHDLGISWYTPIEIPNSRGIITILIMKRDIKRTWES